MKQHHARTWPMAVVVAVSLLGRLSSSAAAQGVEPDAGIWFPFSLTVERQEQSQRTGALVGAGFLGAVVGFVGGAVLGYQLERRYFPCSCDDPGLVGLIVGSAMGSAVAIPIAVHVANGKRGSLGRSLGASALIGSVGLLGLSATASSEAGLVFLFGPPLAEIGVSVSIEQSSTRRARSSLR